MRRVPGLLVAAALAVSVASAASPGPSLANPHPCSGIAGFTCSTLTVPFDRSGRVEGSLRLAVAAADGASATRGVLLFLAGGPGQPAIPALPRIVPALRPLLTEYRLVVYDQRGTGAGALECPALQRAMGFSDLLSPPADAVRACAARLGAKRRLFGTDDVVADMEALREALGV